MTDLRRKLRSRLFAWNWEEWNRPTRAKLLVPVFTLLGGAGSLLLASALVHRGYDLDGTLFVAVFSVGALCLGLLVLALVD